MPQEPRRSHIAYVLHQFHLGGQGLPHTLGPAGDAFQNNSKDYPSVMPPRIFIFHGVALHSGTLRHRTLKLGIFSFGVARLAALANWLGWLAWVSSLGSLALGLSLASFAWELLAGISRSGSSASGLSLGDFCLGS